MDEDTASEAAPVRAWRYWQVSSRGRLRSVSQRHVEWPPGQPLHAVCLAGGHPAPSASCNCGISGARDLETLRQYGLCVAPGPLIVGQIDLWGRTVAEPHYGFRSEYGRPASLGLVRQSVDEAALPSLLEALSRYAVPVTVIALDDAVAGVTAATLAFQMMSARASGTVEQ